MIKMTDEPVNKLLDKELPVPTAWRDILKQIADELVSGKAPSGANVRAVPSDVIQINIENIENYPDAIGTLQYKTWTSSIHVWTGDYWEVLIDLSTAENETSDLVLHLRVYEVGINYDFQPGLIYVP